MRYNFMIQWHIGEGIPFFIFSNGILRMGYTVIQII